MDDDFPNVCDDREPDLPASQCEPDAEDRFAQGVAADAF